MEAGLNVHELARAADDASAVYAECEALVTLDRAVYYSRACSRKVASQGSSGARERIDSNLYVTIYPKICLRSQSAPDQETVSATACSLLACEKGVRREETAIDPRTNRKGSAKGRSPLAGGA